MTCFEMIMKAEVTLCALMTRDIRPGCRYKQSITQLVAYVRAVPGP